MRKLTTKNANTAGGTKKSVIATVEWAAVCTGNAIGPQLFGADKPPYYFIGLRSEVISLSVIILVTVVMAVWLHILNKRNAAKRRARGDAQRILDLSLAPESTWAALREQQKEINRMEGVVDTAVGGQAFLDLTDLENDEFHYSF